MYRYFQCTDISSVQVFLMYRYFNLQVFLMYRYFQCTGISNVQLFLMYKYFQCTGISNVQIFPVNQELFLDLLCI